MQTLISLPALWSNLYLWNHNLKILVELRMRVTSSIHWPDMKNTVQPSLLPVLVLKPTLMATSLPFPDHLAFSFCTSVQTLSFIYNAFCYISDCQKSSHLLKPNSNTTFSVMQSFITLIRVITSFIHFHTLPHNVFFFFYKCIYLLSRFVGCPSHFYLPSFLHSVVDIN